MEGAVGKSTGACPVTINPPSAYLGVYQPSTHTTYFGVYQPSTLPVFLGVHQPSLCILFTPSGEDLGDGDGGGSGELDGRLFRIPTGVPHS